MCIKLPRLRSSGECVIAVPDQSLAQQVIEVGNCCGRDVDKFALTDLTPLAAQEVDAPIVLECFAHLEFGVVDTWLVPRYELVVLEVVRTRGRRAKLKPRMLHHRGYGVFVVDGEGLRFKSGTNRREMLVR
ncbi:flavin reductase family protein [Paraburkholderia sp. UYCP14C]|uniref:flavin reductase family protein n=1 Tax=Paraburkholderia sp. UYCP14C TaxID=2511130 RepID=UPI0027D2139D|nr:flavin reductase [Paraburkholderia sp. UYCP14C]